jgi:capsular polysaccharide biosynthesis protein
MTPQPDGRAAAPELDVEQEIDLGRYWDALVARWWLPVLGVVAGAIIGYLVTLSSSTTYKATAQVYLGTPLAVGGAAQVTSAPTNLGLVSNLVTAESSLKAAAARAGLRVARLRGHVTTKALTGITGAKLGTPAPLLSITVSGSPPAKIARAANALADIVIKRVSPYAAAKIQALEDQLTYDDDQLKALTDRLSTARQAQSQVLADKSISPTDKLVSLGNLNSVITLALQQLNTLSQDRFEVRQELALAKDVEASSLISPAAPVRTAGPSKRTGAVVGALIGLVVGLLAAVLWDPVASRIRPSAQS